MPGINDLKDAQALVGSLGKPDFSGIPDEGAEQPDFSGIPDAPELTFSRAMGALYYPARQMVGAHATTIKSYRDFIAKDQTVESMSEPLDPFAEDYARMKGEKPTATVFDTEYGRMPIEAKIRVNTRVDELREQGMPESTARKQATFDEIKAQQARINSDLTAVEAATRLPEEFKASSGVAEDLLKGLSSVAVSIPTYIVGGPFVAFMSNYSQMHGIKVQELDDIGVEDPASRLKAGMVSGAMQAPLETLSDVFMLSRWMKANGTWTGALMRIAEGAVGEGVTEYAQQYPDEFATLLALNPDVSLMDISRHMDAHAADIRADAAYAGFIGAMVGGVTTGAGVSVATIAQRMLTPQQKAINEKRAARIDYLANKENLTAEDEAELRADLGLAADADVKDIIRQVKKQFELEKPIKSEARDAALAFHQAQLGPEQAEATIALTDALARSAAERGWVKSPGEFYGKMSFERAEQQAEPATEAELFQNDQGGGAKGSFEKIISGGNVQAIIRHFESSDPSTTIHELGHFLNGLLWEQGDSDYLSLAEWAGVDHERALAGIGSWTREEHERVGRAFEVYLMEGKSPSQRLQAVFQRMKAWLVEIYKSVTSLGVELDDNVRDVFDRLLTTEIERAENPILEVREWFNVDETVKGELARRALDTERAVGMEYDEVVAAARNAVIADKQNKKQKAEKKIRAEMMKEAQKSIEDDPFYAMVDEMMGNGGMKASVIEDLYDSATIGELNRRRPGIVAKDGFHPDVVGMQYGYHSIDDIVQDILNKPTKKEAVQSYFDGLWAEYERFEHLNWAETYEQSIDAEIAMVSKLLGKEHKPRAAKGIKTTIGKITGVIKTDELKQLADDMKRDAKIAREAWNAARKAMREGEMSELKAEKVGALMEQKRKALEKLLAVKEDHQSRMAELKLQYQERHRVQTYQRKIKKILKNKGLSIDARSQIAAFLSDYMDIPPKFRGEPPAMTLQEYVESKRETEGDYVVDWLLEEYADRPPANQRTAKGYRVPLSSDGLDPIYRVAAMIEHMDLGDRKLQAMQAQLDHERDVAGKVKRIHEVWGQPDDPEHPLDIITKRDRIAWFTNLSEGSKRFGAELMKCEFIFDALDGWEVRGPNGELFAKIARAENAELLLGAEISGRITRAFDAVAGKNVNAWAQKLHQVQGVSITDRATGTVSRLLTKEQMIAIALNSGNDGNRTALREGNGLTDEQIDAVWAALTPGEQGLVREIWTTINTLFPQLDAVHRRLTGVPLKKVDGDYYPMVFSRTLSENAAKYAEREAAKDLTYAAQTYHRPSVSAGHRKARKGGKLGLDLSLGVISKHIVQTVHDITHSVPVREVQKVVADPTWRAAVVGSVGEPFYQQIMPWLSNVARPMHDEGGNFAAKARKASTLVALGLRVTTMLQQWTAIFPTIGREGLLPTLQAIGKFYANPIHMANFVNEVDPKMKFRKDSFSQELAIFRDRFGKKFFKGHNAIINASFYMIELFDAMVRYPTWVVGYQNAMKETGGNHAAAVEAASKTVAKTQGWGSEKDLAMWQRGGKTRSEYKKLFYMFSTYFNLFANQLWETQARWRLGNISTARAAQQYMWTMIFPAMIGGILQRWRLPEGGEWLTDQIRYLLAGIPVVRDVANGMLNLFVGGGPVDYQMSPVERIPNKALEVAKHLASDKPDATRKAAMDALELSGYVFRLPTGQLSVTMDGVFDLMNGQGTVAGLLKRPERPKSKNVKPSM